MVDDGVLLYFVSKGVVKIKTALAVKTYSRDVVVEASVTLVSFPLEKQFYQITIDNNSMIFPIPDPELGPKYAIANVENFGFNYCPVITYFYYEGNQKIVYNVSFILSTNEKTTEKQAYINIPSASIIRRDNSGIIVYVNVSDAYSELGVWTQSAADLIPSMTFSITDHVFFRMSLIGVRPNNLKFVVSYNDVITVYDPVVNGDNYSFESNMNVVKGSIMRFGFTGNLFLTGVTKVNIANHEF